MSPEITTLAAAGATAALLGARAVRHQRIAGDIAWFALTLPRRVDGDAVVSALRSLSGLTSGPMSVVMGTGAVILEVGVHDSEIVHRVAVPSTWEAAVLGQLHAAMPGLHVRANPPRPAVQFAIELGRRGDARLRDDDSETVAAGVLIALSGISGTAVIQWTITPIPGSARRTGVGAPRSPTRPGTAARRPGAHWNHESGSAWATRRCGTRIIDTGRAARTALDPVALGRGEAYPGETASAVVAVPHHRARAGWPHRLPAR